MDMLVRDFFFAVIECVVYLPLRGEAWCLFDLGIWCPKSAGRCG